MENIKLTIRIICFASLSIGILNSFVSDKKLSKSVNLISGLIFLLLIINPIIKNDFSFSMPKPNINSQISEIDVTSETLKLTKEKLENLLKDELIQKGIEVDYITVECESNENGSVSIKSINCKVKINKDIKRATEILSERTQNSGCLTVT